MQTPIGLIHSARRPAEFRSDRGEPVCKPWRHLLLTPSVHFGKKTRTFFLIFRARSAQPALDTSESRAWTLRAKTHVGRIRGKCL